MAKVKSAYAEYFMASKSVEIHRELLELIRHTTATAEGLYQVGQGSAAGYHQGDAGAH